MIEAAVIFKLGKFKTQVSVLRIDKCESRLVKHRV